MDIAPLGQITRDRCTDSGGFMGFNHYAALVLSTLALLAGCDHARDSAVRIAPEPHESAALERDPPAFDPTEVEQRLIDHVWINAAAGALVSPTQVALPYAEWGGFLAS